MNHKNIYYIFNIKYSSIYVYRSYKNICDYSKKCYLSFMYLSFSKLIWICFCQEKISYKHNYNAHKKSDNT